MLIECVIDRKEPVVVSISNETYTFKPDAKGRKIAEVWIPTHIKSFLAVSYFYRELVDAPEPAPEPVVAPAPRKRKVAA